MPLTHSDPDPNPPTHLSNVCPEGRDRSIYVHPEKKPRGSEGRGPKVARSHGGRTNRKDAFPPAGNYNIFHNPKGQWTIYHVTDLLTVPPLSI